jgi:hypothetical protein
MSPENSLSGVNEVRDESPVVTSEQLAHEAGTSMGPFLLNQRQAAALLGISTRTLARRSADGTIPSFLIGRRRVYSRFRLTQWVAEQAA